MSASSRRQASVSLMLWAPPADIGENLSLFGEIDGGFLLAFEARAPDGRFSLLADGLYLSLRG